MLEIEELVDLDDIDRDDDEPWHISKVGDLAWCGYVRPPGRQVYDGPVSEFPVEMICGECLLLIPAYQRAEFKP